ncbi:hypothetical protein QR680_004398 [Steinernema hermaphroditum]|uniref:Uncharacterized protein n=1 Tax=Steinernema hermaphroditum TaxID=289476 RepID=A0AA39HQS5_9BILA|nr:hypothetical protein QR680_004398 [Steinernema hermaphroditum]
MNELPYGVIENITDLISFDALLTVAQSATGSAEWSAAIEDQLDARCDVRLILGVGQLTEGNSILLDARHSPFSGPETYRRWDLKNRHLARLSSVAISGASLDQRNCEKEEFSTVINLLQCPVIRGKNEQPTMFHIGETPKSDKATISLLIEHIPRTFEEVSLVMIHEQPELLNKTAEHFKTGPCLLKISILDCDIDYEILHTLIEIFLSKRQHSFEAVISYCLPRFPSKAVVEFIEKFKESDGEYNGVRKKISLEMEEEQWAKIAAEHETLLFGHHSVWRLRTYCIRSMEAKEKSAGGSGMWSVSWDGRFLTPCQSLPPLASFRPVSSAFS